MRAEKYELVRAIDQVRNVIKKNPVIPSLEGILVRDGYFTGSNAELTVQVKSEAPVGETFIIPPSAMDMIKSLPDGEVEITCQKDDVIQIRAGKVKHRCQSFSPETYAYYKANADYDNEISLPGEALMNAFSRVAYASDDKGNSMSAGIYLEADSWNLNIVALDGRVVAWEAIPFEGETDIKAIIPKAAALKMASMGFVDEIRVSYNRDSIIFRGENFSVFSRLIDGNYYQYRKFFSDSEFKTTVNRKDLIEAMGRAKLCMTESGAKKPAILTFSREDISVAVASSTSEYEETIFADGVDTGGLMIGFDPAVLIKTARAFTSDMITMGFTSKKMPVFFTEESSGFKALALPVNF